MIWKGVFGGSHYTEAAVVFLLVHCSWRRNGLYEGMTDAEA
jgi:hypothetical protein